METMETEPMIRFSGPLIHYYFVAPAPQNRGVVADDDGHSTGQPAWQPAGTRLVQRWTRRPDGTLAAGWHTI